MIIGFAGTPGSGKSYEAIKKILDNLKLLRKVYTNIDGLQDPEKREMIKFYTGLDDFELQTNLIHFTDEEMQTFWDKVDEGALIVIDEVHRLFSNRDWNTTTNRRFTDWASTHRHYGYDVVLITQDMEKVDKHARSLLEWTYFFRKINQFGGLVKKKYSCFAYSGDDSKGKPITTTTRTYDPKVFACYSSYGSKVAKELGIMKHANILKQPVFYAIPIALIAVLYFGFRSYETGGILGHKIADDLQAVKDKKEGKVKPLVTEKTKDTVQPSISQKQAVTADQTATTFQKNDVPLNHIIKAYKMPNGKILYTNNGIVPAGGKYVGTI